jgi:hypothetical protein
MTILCLCREQHHWNLIPGYADAFRSRGIEFFCVDDSIPFDAPLEDVLQTCPGTPSMIFHFESAQPLFAIGLERSADPRDPGMNTKVNNAVKLREWWRPFAPPLKKKLRRTISNPRTIRRS